LRRELATGLWISVILGLAGFLRALVFFIPWPETIAITTSLFVIVASSVVIGLLMPLCMKAVGIDPAHSRYVWDDDIPPPPSLYPLYLSPFQ